MSKQLLCIATLVGLVAIPFHTASAEGAPEHVGKVLSRFEGDWVTQFEVGGKMINGDLTFELSPSKQSMLLRRTSKDPDTGKVEIGFTCIGWDESRKVVVEYAIGDSGGLLQATHHISSETKDTWNSPCVRNILVDGEIVVEESLRVIKLVDEDYFTVTMTERFVDGKPMPPETMEFKRRKSD